MSRGPQALGTSGNGIFGDVGQTFSSYRYTLLATCALDRPGPIWLAFLDDVLSFPLCLYKFPPSLAPAPPSPLPASYRGVAYVKQRLDSGGVLCRLHSNPDGLVTLSAIRAPGRYHCEYEHRLSKESLLRRELRKVRSADSSSVKAV